MNIDILSNKIENIFNKHKIPSLSVIITNKNKNIFEQYHGYNHLEKQILKGPLHSYFYSEGEIISGIYLGWNFGDGHLHNEHLLGLFQADHAFKEHDIVCVCVEPQGWTRSSLSYRVIDAQAGLVLEGEFQIKELKKGQPWEVIKELKG